MTTVSREQMLESDGHPTVGRCSETDECCLRQGHELPCSPPFRTTPAPDSRQVVISRKCGSMLRLCWAFFDMVTTDLADLPSAERERLVGTIRSNTNRLVTGRAS